MLTGCSTYKKQLLKTGGISSAVKNAIIDFSSTSRFFNADNVFRVSVRANEIEGVFVVGIMKSNTKILFSAEDTIGSTSNIPSRFIEVDGKLFYWRDREYPLSQETLSIFRKYHLLQEDENGTLLYPDFKVDDSSKSTDYFFCVNDQTIYKKVITRVGFGYYKPPVLDCT